MPNILGGGFQSSSIGTAIAIGVIALCALLDRATGATGTIASACQAGGFTDEANRRQAVVRQFVPRHASCPLPSRRLDQAYAVAGVCRAP